MKKKLKLHFSNSPKKTYQDTEDLATLCGVLVDKSQLPSQFNWSNEDVVNWINDLGFPEYQSAFEKNLILGRKLLLVNASALPKMNIQNFELVKKITCDIRKMYGVELARANRSISLTPQEPLTLYKFYKTSTGIVHELCRPTDFFRMLKMMKEPEIKLNHFEKLHKWLQHNPDRQLIRIGNIKRENLYYVRPNPCQELELPEKKESCKCEMPPCVCQWNKKEKRKPWRLFVLVQAEEGKYSDRICK